ncbi:MAG: hypothetical protein KC912_02570 [Proteobacteria bacterium]|nr:hypothetical protein [Pseudomonadota bacterium]
MSEREVQQGLFAGCLIRVGIALLVFLPVWGILAMSIAQLAGDEGGWDQYTNFERILRAGWITFPFAAGGTSIVAVLGRSVTSTGAVFERMQERQARSKYEALSAGADQLPAWESDHLDVSREHTLDAGASLDE